MLKNFIYGWIPYLIVVMNKIWEIIFLLISSRDNKSMKNLIDLGKISSKMFIIDQLR